MFDPKAHLIKLPRRVKDPQSGQWVTRADGYLEVKWRLVWFREKYPHDIITTKETCIALDLSYARFRATVEDGEGGMATGTGTEMRKSFEDFVEKAETRSSWRSPEQTPAWLIPATAGASSTFAGAADLGRASDRRQKETISASASKLRK